MGPINLYIKCAAGLGTKPVWYVAKVLYLPISRDNFFVDGPGESCSYEAITGTFGGLQRIFTLFSMR